MNNKMAAEEKDTLETVWWFFWEYLKVIGEEFWKRNGMLVLVFWQYHPECSVENREGNETTEQSAGVEW